MGSQLKEEFLLSHFNFVTQTLIVFPILDYVIHMTIYYVYLNTLLSSPQNVLNVNCCYCEIVNFTAVYRNFCSCVFVTKVNDDVDYIIKTYHFCFKKYSLIIQLGLTCFQFINSLTMTYITFGFVLTKLIKFQQFYNYCVVMF